MILPSKVVLLVMLNVLLLGKSLGVANKGREYPSYLPQDEKGPEYQVFQYTPNYPFKEDYSECAKNPMIPILGKGLNILLLKLGAIGIVKAVMALMFLGMLLKLPLVLLKMAFMKSFFLPLLMAPLLLNMFSNQMSQSSDSDSKPDDSTGSKPPTNEMTGGVLGVMLPGMISGMPVMMTGMSPNGAGKPMMVGGMSTNGAGKPTNGAGMPSNGAGMPGNGAGMSTNGAGMSTNGAGMSTNGAEGRESRAEGGIEEERRRSGMSEKMGKRREAHMRDISRSMTDVIMEMGRQMNDNLTTVAWKSLKMFAESDQCAEKISCTIGAYTKDSSIENIFTRILKYLQYSSPPFLQKRVSRIREAFLKGSRDSTCLSEDYECHSPELLLKYGIKKVKIL